MTIQRLSFAAILLGLSVSTASADVSGYPDSMETGRKPRPTGYEDRSAPGLDDYRDQDRFREREMSNEGPRGRKRLHEDVKDDDSGIPQVGIKLQLFAPRLRNRVEIESNNGTGNEVSIHNLGINRREIVANFVAWARVADKWDVEFGYIGHRYTGRKINNRGFNFDGQAFPSGQAVRARAKIELGWLGARFTPVVNENFRLTLPMGLLYHNEVVELRTGGTVAKGRVDAWSPYVGVGLDWRINRILGAEAEVRGHMWATGSVDFFGYFDIKTNIYAQLTDNFRVYLGPRFITVNNRRDGRNERNAQWEMRGLEFGLALQF